MQGGSVAEQGQVFPLAQGLCHPQRHAERTDVVGERLLLAVTVQAFHHQGRLLGFEKGVVHPRRLGHVAWHAHVHSSDGVDDGPHGRTAVPNAFQSVTAGADDEGRLLATRRTVAYRGEVVAHDLQGVVEVVEVLDFCNGTQAAHRHAYALPQNGAFADARVADANLPKLFLHALHHLVHSSDAARVFPERQDAWIAGEHRLEIALQNLTAIELLGLCVVRGGDGRDAQGAVGLVAVQRAAVPLVVVTVERLQPAAQGLA